MAISTVDLQSKLNSIDFSISFKDVSLISNFQKIKIPFIGYANPSKTESVSITKTEYSLDGGITWHDMDVDTSQSNLNNLTFSLPQ